MFRRWKLPFQVLTLEAEAVQISKWGVSHNAISCDHSAGVCSHYYSKQ